MPRLVWQDGDMPYSVEFGDFFYSRADGRAECAHVFIAGNDLVRRFGAGGVFTVAELGFGTGLNFAETWRQWKRLAPKGARLDFESFELAPMGRADIDRALSAWPDLADERLALVAAWPEQPITDVDLDFGPVSLRVAHGDALARLGDSDLLADAWYLDGFSPARNKAMWSADLMAEVARHTRSGGTFATYSAAGWVRRNLAEAGFIVAKHPGHAGKRDMTAGRLDPERAPSTGR